MFEKTLEKSEGHAKSRESLCCALYFFDVLGEGFSGSCGKALCRVYFSKSRLISFLPYLILVESIFKQYCQLVLNSLYFFVVYKKMYIDNYSMAAMKIPKAIPITYPPMPETAVLAIQFSSIIEYPWSKNYEMSLADIILGIFECIYLLYGFLMICLFHLILFDSCFPESEADDARGLDSSV